MRNDIVTRFLPGQFHPRYRSDAALLQELAKHAIKSLQLTGRIEMRGRSRRYCEVICSECEQVQFILVDNILSGKTTNCKCQRHRKYPLGSPAETLGQRYDAIVQRCERDSHVSSKHYKGRGIKSLFRSRQHFILWALQKWPNETFKGKDFDRINNDGHYSPQNLRLVNRSTNLLNRRRRKSRQPKASISFAQP